jgi:hypothetical protein
VLAAVHAKGIVHRDLKPDNVFLEDKRGGASPFLVRILDFGIAKLMAVGPSSLTKSGMVLGTPSYMAPEQYAGDRAIDTRADIYSLGCMLFEMATGSPPFVRAGLGSLITAQMSEPPPSVAKSWASAPAGFVALVAQMLAKEPADRPQTMVEVEARLNAALTLPIGSATSSLRDGDGASPDITVSLRTQELPDVGTDALEEIPTAVLPGHRDSPPTPTAIIPAPTNPSPAAPTGPPSAGAPSATSAAGLMLLVGCGDLPALPGAPSSDGASSGQSVDGADRALDQGPASRGIDAPDAPALDASLAPRVDASDTRAVDGPGAPPVDVSRVPAVDGAATPSFDGSRNDGRSPGIDAPAADAPKAIVCRAGYLDCNGDNIDCETSITTPEHCGGCKTACGSVANGAATCSNGKCTVKCTAPYQDCDGKYETGCEIPVGRGNACDRSGLAAFSGDKPPCGTPYCGSASASTAVTNFGSWYCSFCEHCYIFGNGGSWCLFSAGAGNFSGSRCTECCAADDDQVCPR